MALSTGWSASRLAPRTGLPGTPLGGPGSGAATPQQNPIFAALAQVLGIKPPVVQAAFNPATLNLPGTPPVMGPTPAAGVDYLARAATAGTPAERAADKIATAAETAKTVPTPTPGVVPRSAPGAFSQSGNIAQPNSVYRAPTLSPLQSGLAQALGIAPTAAPSPTIAGTPVTPAPGVGGLVGFSGGSLPTGGLAPGQRPYVSPLNAIAPATNATIPGVTNFNTLANQNQNLPDWLRNAIMNLNNPDNMTPAAPAVPLGGGFDPRIGATMAATEARIAAQQKELAEANKLRIQQAKAEAAAIEHAQELNIQRLRVGGGGINYQSGWGAF